jgi:hypothetical protein
MDSIAHEASRRAQDGDENAILIRREGVIIDPKPARELFRLGVLRMNIGAFLAAAAPIAFENAADGPKKNGTLQKEVFG